MTRICIVYVYITTMWGLSKTLHSAFDAVVELLLYPGGEDRLV